MLYGDARLYERRTRKYSIHCSSFYACCLLFIFVRRLEYGLLHLVLQRLLAPCLPRYGGSTSSLQMQNFGRRLEEMYKGQMKYDEKPPYIRTAVQ